MGDAWQDGLRKQLADHEHRSSELGQVLANEKRALEVVELQLKKLKDERAALDKKTAEAKGRARTVRAAAATAQAAGEQAVKESEVLQRHLELLRARLLAAGQQLQDIKVQYAQHLALLRAALDAYRRKLGGDGGAAA